MNLQDLRAELTTRADEAATREPDLLPGVRHKIRRTKQRRTATALASVAAVAALAVAVVPGVVNNSAPGPANEVPPDYVKDGQTVPGMVNGDKLLKAWIADPGQRKLSFAWTPTTDKISVYASCDNQGFAGPAEVRVSMGGRFLGAAACDDGSTESPTVPIGSFLADSTLWLTAPVGKATTVSAEVVATGDGGEQPSADNIKLGIYSVAEPTRGIALLPEPGPDDFQQDGVFYRRKVGGDTLLGAAVGRLGSNEVRFKFTPGDAPLSLRPFCTAGDNQPLPAKAPYELEITFNGKLATRMTCSSTSVDAGASGTFADDQQAPAGREVEVLARLVRSGENGPPLPTDGRLGLGIYSQGPRRDVGGVRLQERITVGGSTYRLSTFESAPGPKRQVQIDVPLVPGFVLAYGGAGLGNTGAFRAEARLEGAVVGGMEVEAGSGGNLGIGTENVASSGPDPKAALVLTQGRPTGGTLVIAIYLPD